MSTAWIVHAVAPGAVAAAVARRVPSLAGAPIVLTGGRGGQGAVVHACPLALAAGVTRGMSVADALARHRKIVAVPCPCRPQDALTSAIREAFGHVVRTDGADEVSLAVEACDDPKGWHPRMASWFRETLGVTASVAVGAQPLVARVAAHCPERVPAVIGPGDEESMMPVPLSCLPWLSRHAVETLAHGWAVFTVGDLADLPGAFVLKLLGREGLDLHAAARDHNRKATPDTQARVTLSPATNDPARLRWGVLRAVDHAWHCLAASGMSVRRLELRIWRCGDTPVVRGVMCDPDAEDPLTLGRQAACLLDALWSRRAVEAVEARLWSGPPSGSQLALFPELRVYRLSGLGSALGTLRRRYGPTTVGRASTLTFSPD